MKFWRKPLDADKVKQVLGKVVIITDRCKGCGFCIEFCPRGVLEFSSDFNKMGYHSPTVTDSKACVNCGLCEMLCPEFAIFSVLEEDESTS